VKWKKGETALGGRRGEKRETKVLVQFGQGILSHPHKGKRAKENHRRKFHKNLNNAHGSGQTGPLKPHQRPKGNQRKKKGGESMKKSEQSCFNKGFGRLHGAARNVTRKEENRQKERSQEATHEHNLKRK